MSYLPLVVVSMKAPLAFVVAVLLPFVMFSCNFTHVLV